MAWSKHLKSFFCMDKFCLATDVSVYFEPGIDSVAQAGFILRQSFCQCWDDRGEPPHPAAEPLAGERCPHVWPVGHVGRSPRPWTNAAAFAYSKAIDREELRAQKWDLRCMANYIPSAWQEIHKTYREAAASSSASYLDRHKLPEWPIIQITQKS